jgi:hypothetical protein
MKTQSKFYRWAIPRGSSSRGVQMRQKASEDVVYSSLVEEHEALLCAAGKETPLSLDVQVLNDCPHADQQSYGHNPV